MKYEEISKGVQPSGYFTVSYNVQYPITINGDNNYSGTYHKEDRERVDERENTILVNVKEPEGKKQITIGVPRIGEQLSTVGNEGFNENERFPLFVGELDDHLVYVSIYTWSGITLLFYPKPTD